MREDEHVFAREIAPNVHVSSTARIPNKIKLRKKLRLWPIKFSAGLDYSVFAAQDKVKWVASCKEQFFGGRVTLDLDAQTINYKKNFWVDGGPSFCLQAQCPFRYTGHFAPTIGVNFISGNTRRRSNITSVGSNSFDVRTKVPLSRHIRAEVCGNVRLPMLTPQYTVGASTIDLPWHDEVGNFELHLAEVNAIVYA